MKQFIVWLFKKKTGLEKYQLSMAFYLYYFMTRSKAKAYWRVWNHKAT